VQVCAGIGVVGARGASTHEWAGWGINRRSGITEVLAHLAVTGADIVVIVGFQ
jgi:hypothetical protein